MIEREGDNSFMSLWNHEDEACGQRLGRGRGCSVAWAVAKDRLDAPASVRKRQVLQFSSCGKDVSFGGFVWRIISLARLPFRMCNGLNVFVPSGFLVKT